METRPKIDEYKMDILGQKMKMSQNWGINGFKIGLLIKKIRKFNSELEKRSFLIFGIRDVNHRKKWKNLKLLFNNIPSKCI